MLSRGDSEFSAGTAGTGADEDYAAFSMPYAEKSEEMCVLFAARHIPGKASGMSPVLFLGIRA